MKGSHNSLRLSIPLYLQLSLSPLEWACHSVELDLVQSPEADALGVSHLGTYQYTYHYRYQLSLSYILNIPPNNVLPPSDRVATLEVVLKELKSTHDRTRLSAHASPHTPLRTRMLMIAW
jgi:hypothetical protein